MSDDKTPSIDTIVLAQLAETATTMTSIMERMSSHYDGHARDIEYIREALAHARNSIAKIARVLHEGNGEKPLVTRVYLLEQAITDLTKQFEKYEAATNEALRAQKAGRWKLITASVSGILALATAVVSLLAGS